ncbi:MAG: molybdenum cofactor guanylyltransferase [Hyphomicrobiales bacterium]
MVATVDCAAIILAGGESSRMGKDKSSLCFKGKTLLRHMGDVLTHAGLEKSIISGPNHIADEIRGAGPLGGVHAVLRHVGGRHAHLVFAPVDMPALTSRLIRRLMNAPPSHALVHYAAHKVPFRLSTDKRWFELADSLLRDGENVSLGYFQECVPGRLALEVEDGDRSAFANINTANEWRMFRQGQAL